MKKNNTMRIAAGLAVAALLSTCLVSGTYAKYVTSGASSDTARVAKWGVTVTATDNSAFKTAYDGTVESQTTKNVVAPGTSGSMTAVALSGKPEVDVEVTNVADVQLGDKWVDGDGSYYCPLIVTVGATSFDGTKYANASAFANAIKGAIDGTTATYDAGTDLATDGCPAISWKWAFGDTEKAEQQTDEKDTALGNAAQTEANAPTISIKVTTTVTQIN